jgi:hypothetical protein
MTNNALALTAGSTKIWTMPILPEQYDQSPLTQEEWQALEYCDGLLGPPMKFTTLSSKNASRSTAWYHA